MQTFYKFTILSRNPQLLANLPKELTNLECHSFEGSDDEFYVVWDLKEPDFYLIPSLRRWLQQVPSLQLFEEGATLFSQEEKKQAQLLHLVRGYWEGAELIGSPPVVQVMRCPACGVRQKRIVETPILQLKLQSGLRPGFFYVNDAEVYVMTRELFDALHERGFTSGLSTFPVKIDAEPSAQYLGIFCPVSLGWPAAPFGHQQPVCNLCGRVDPAYSLFHTFYRPKQPAHWMSIPYWGELARWLLGDGLELIGVAPGFNEFDVEPLGWCPDDNDLAFLPEALRNSNV